MGIKIVTNNKNNWKLYSTVSGGLIAKFKTEKELIKHIAMEDIYKAKLNAIERIMKYPNGLMINDKIMFSANEESGEKYNDWRGGLFKIETYDEYYEAIDKKLDELLKEE